MNNTLTTLPERDTHIIPKNGINSLVDFLNFLNRDRHLLVAIHTDKRIASISKIFTDTVEAEQWATKLNKKGYNLYWTVNPIKDKYVINKKCSKDDIAYCEYIFLDLDPKDLIKRDKLTYTQAREQVVNTAEALKDIATFIIDSGNGVGVFIKIEDGKQLNPKEVKKLNRDYEKRYVGDSTSNIDRVMRLPFTTNYSNKVKKDAGYPDTSVSSMLYVNTHNVITNEAVIEELNNIIEDDEVFDDTELKEAMNSIKSSKTVEQVIKQMKSDDTWEKNTPSDESKVSDSECDYGALCTIMKYCDYDVELTFNVFTHTKYYERAFDGSKYTNKQKYDNDYLKRRTIPKVFKNIHTKFRQIEDNVNSKYDRIFFDIQKGKFTFIKGNKIFSHTKQNASCMFDDDLTSKQVNEILSKAPRLYPEYNPCEKEEYIKDGLKCINTFKPSKYIVNSKDKVNEIPKNIDFLLKHLIKDDETRNVFIHTLANHLQNGTSIHTGWIFSGVAGAGKGTLMDIIFEMFGKHNCQKSKLTNFTGDKVKGVPEKLIAYVDESADSKIMYEVVENLKAIIANDVYSSRALGVNEVDVLNFGMYFFTVNSFGFKLSADDRRMNIIECGTKLNSVVSNMITFRKYIFNEIQAFTDYLLNFNVDKKLIFTIVKTEFREKMITQNLPLAERLSKCFIENTLEHIEAEISDDKFDNDECENVENWLNHIHSFDRVQGTVVSELIESLFKLTDIKEDYFKKNAVTKLLKDKYDYKAFLHNSKTSKGYILNETGDKTLTHDEFNKYKIKNDFDEF